MIDRRRTRRRVTVAVVAKLVSRGRKKNTVASLASERCAARHGKRLGVADIGGHLFRLTRQFERVLRQTGRHKKREDADQQQHYDKLDQGKPTVDGLGLCHLSQLPFSGGAAAPSDLRQHHLGAAHFVLPGRFDVQLLHHSVLDQHRIALRAHAHVARSEVEREPELLGPLAAAVAEHADLAARLLVAAPGGHHECVVRRHAPDLVHAFRLELAVVLHVARNVLRRAGRRIRARHGEDRDFLSFRRLGDADVLGVDRASRGGIVFGGFGKLAVGKSVADFDGHFGLRSLEFSGRSASRSWAAKSKCLPVPRGLAIFPAMRTAAEAVQDHRLTLSEVLHALVAEGLVPKADADKLVADRRLHRGDHHPLVVIADQKWRSLKPPQKVLFLEWLTEWLARQTGMDYFHIDPLKINFSAVTEVMSSHYAARFKILPVEVSTREVVIATCEPYVKDWEKELKQILRLEIRRVIANPLDISRYQVEFYNLAKSVKGAAKMGEQRSGIGNFEQLVQIGQTNKQLDANDQHIVHVVDWLWQYAFDQRASDIHMEPRRDAGEVRFRIDGVLHPVYQIPMAVMAAMTSRIKILGRMDVVEKRRPQDGRIKTRTADGQDVELRLSTLPTAFGEKLVMRVFDPEVIVKDFAELGFSEDDKTRWKQMTGQPNGIILVTGPTGSGKTTTLYSTLKTLATPEVNVCTIEDPIEMIEPAFNQMQVQQSIELGFAEGVRALMRQDPDIIMVGEIRDVQTAEMAVQAALTGHLVLSTLHTNDSASAITRLLELGVPAYLLNSTILGVMAQRLVRTLCKHCKEKIAYEPGREGDLSWEEFVAPWKAKRPAHVYRPVGCLECRNTGYSGRIGLYEILLLSPEVKRLVNSEADVAKIRDQAYKEGMKPLRISGAMKVAMGLTTLEEVLKVAPPPGQA